MYIINQIQIKQEDGYLTKVTHFSCNKPKATILLLHGMAEHQKRYHTFASYLAEQEYDVYCYDHRGHGLDKKIKDLGFISNDYGYKLLINDAIHISKFIKCNNRCDKLFLLGHSMGSLIARNVIQIYDKYNGVILSGTTFPSNLLTYMGLFLSWLITKIKGHRHISPFLNSLMFGNKYYTALSDRTVYDWLSRSHTIVGAYINDPYCGFICTASFYHDLLKLVANASKTNLILKTKKDLPLFIISGDKDPVGRYGKEIKSYLSVLEKLGFNKIDSKLYRDCRHELLNELNKEDVYFDILHWISSFE
ncbi:MAG: alpha/beta hydrolase [Clostridiales bacterium]|nr:alpha/beta hydrolase [Clostridiales bacterium]